MASSHQALSFYSQMLLQFYRKFFILDHPWTIRNGLAQRSERAFTARRGYFRDYELSRSTERSEETVHKQINKFYVCQFSFSNLSIYLSIYLSTYLFIYLSIYLSD